MNSAIVVILICFILFSLADTFRTEDNLHNLDESLSEENEIEGSSSGSRSSILPNTQNITSSQMSEKDEQINLLKAVCRSGFSANMRLREKSKKLRAEKRALEIEKMKRTKANETPAPVDWSSITIRQLHSENAELKEKLIWMQTQAEDLTGQLTVCENNLMNNERSMTALMEYTRPKREHGNSEAEGSPLSPESIKVEEEEDELNNKQKLEVEALLQQVDHFQNGTILLNGVLDDKSGRIHLNPSKIVSIKFVDISINLKYLYRLLNRTQNLEILGFDNVKIMSTDTEVNENDYDYVALPFLNQFDLNQRGLIQNGDDLTKYLNLPQTSNPDDKIVLDSIIGESISNFGLSPNFETTNVYISVDGVNILKWNKTLGSMTSMLPSTYRVLTLGNMAGLHSLHLSHCTADVNLIPEDIADLNLYQVSLINGGLSRILRKSHHLVDLKFRSSTGRDGEPQSSIHLAEIPATLKSLTLWDTKVKYSPSVSLELDELVLYDTELQDVILRNFSDIFKPKIVSVNAHYWPEHPYTLLAELLKIERIEEIQIFNLPRINRGMPPAIANFNEMQNFLKSVGVQNPQVGFTLQKSVGGAWAGKQIQWNLNFEPKQIVYNTFGLDKFLPFHINEKIRLFSF